MEALEANLRLFSSFGKFAVKKSICAFCDLNYHSPSVNLQGFAIGRSEKYLRDLRTYSPRIKDVAWLEDAPFIFLIFHALVCKFGRVDAVRGKKKYRQMYGKLEKLTERLLAKLHPSNLVNTIFHLVFYTSSE